MSLSTSYLARLKHFSPAILGATESEIRAGILSEKHSVFRDEALSLGREGDFSSFYAPFDWVNEAADVVIVGVTPGRQQALEALTVLRQALVTGLSIEEAAQRAKTAASFKGGMRTLGARLMDHFQLNTLFGLETTLDLFGDASSRAHYTSALRYPVLKRLGNYAGDARLLARPLLRKMVHEHLAVELALLPNAWIVPFDPTAHLAVAEVAKQGNVSLDRVLGGILHPGGQQWNRYNVQLDLVDDDAAAKVPGGLEVIRRSAALREKVCGALATSKSATATMSEL